MVSPCARPSAPMALNESRGWSRSSLTPQQKREAEAAIYGLQEPAYPMSNDLSTAEIERMRAMIAQHEQKTSVTEFDLNKPPVEPYVYQPFPKTVYHPDGRNRIVRDEPEMEMAMEAGWGLKPITAGSAVEQAHLEPDAAAEVARIDSQLVRRGPGRPPKVQVNG